MADNKYSINPRKFCELCKCWYYNNKVSTEHHEKGVRHQANVKNKIRETGKRGRERERDEMETRRALIQMERGARASCGTSAPPFPSSYFPGAAFGESPDLVMQQPQLNFTPGISTVWREVLDPTSRKCYYWNSKTNETSWQKPVHGYLSVEEQQFAFEFEHPEFAVARTAEQSENGEERAEVPGKANTSVEQREQDSESGPPSSSKPAPQNPAEDINSTEMLPFNADPESALSSNTVAFCPKNPLGKWKAVEESQKRALQVLPFDTKSKNKDNKLKKLKFEEKPTPAFPTRAKLSKSSTTQMAPVTFKKLSKATTLRSLKSRDDDE